MSKQILLTLCCGIVLGCGEAPTSTSEMVPAETAKVSFNTAGAPTVEFSVPDMMCEESCAKAVHDTLAAQPGAVDVLVDYPNKTATVAIENDKFDSEAALAALLDKQFSNSKLISDAGATTDKSEETKADAPEAPAAPVPDDQKSQG